MALREGETIYFYELHEGDDEVFSDILLAHDAEYDEQEFLELVLEARTKVLATFEEDSLSEAIAHELQSAHGFLPIDDTQLRVAINVSSEEGETAVAGIDERSRLRGVGAREEEDFRSLVLDVEIDDAVWGND
jgi:hypothetical protein